MELTLFLKNLGIDQLNPMQESSLKAAQHFTDFVLLSPTGSGKTLAFLLPVLRNLDPNKNGVQALVLVPARELALQIEKVFKKMKTHFKVSTCYGGHDKKIEANNLVEAPALLIGTPGRIADHLRAGNFNPDTIHTLVLDEFDKSLEFGFQNEMSFIVSTLKGLRQRMLTSATFMDEIPDFVGLQQEKRLNFLQEKSIKPNLQFKKILSAPEEKIETLFHLICKIGNQRTLIFCNHREAVDRISELLQQSGIARESFHGGMLQDEREKALLKFRNGSTKILITTDLAARGLDIPEVASIVHYQLPYVEDAFIHRNGRTARMMAKGEVYLIMTQDEDYPFLDHKIPTEDVSQYHTIPEATPFETLYISVGKKDKVNKVDIVGFMIKKGELAKEEVGIIEVKDKSSYVAIARNKVKETLKKLSIHKLKGKKVKIEIAK